VNPAYISATSVLFGSAIGALGSLAATWWTHRHNDTNGRRLQDKAQRERLFMEFIDRASTAFVDALLQTSLHDPSKLVPLYASIGKLRLVASERTLEAADGVMDRIVETYYAPKFDLQTKPSLDERFDILREFTERCQAELR